MSEGRTLPNAADFCPPLEGTGFEPPVRGRGQPDCRSLADRLFRLLDATSRVDGASPGYPLFSRGHRQPISVFTGLSQCWFFIAMTACAAKFCNSAICLSEAGVPPHSGAHRAATSPPLGGGAQPPGGRRRAFYPPGRGMACDARFLGGVSGPRDTSVTAAVWVALLRHPEPQRHEASHP